MRAQVRGFPDMAAARSVAHQIVANVSVAALPVVGILSNADMVSCFVEVPFNLVSRIPKPTARTILEIGSYQELLLSLSDLLSGSDRIGFLLTSRPLWLAGEEYQPEDVEKVIALVEGLMTAAGARLIGGPIRCRRCNHPVPVARARIVGSSNCLCIRCQQIEERR
jgi:hypothetical protein